MAYRPPGAMVVGKPLEATQRPSRAELRVQGMTCGACSGAVTRALQARSGVLEAEVSLLREKASVTFDASKVSAEELRTEVEDIGFDATILSFEEDHPPRQLARAELRVQGMTCGACSGAVERALRAQPGVEEANVSLLRESATVSFDPSVVSADQLCSEVEDIGFDAAVLGIEDLAQAGAGKLDSKQPTRCRAELQVLGMTCGACSGAVERALRTRQGVVEVVVSLLRQRASVAFLPEEVSAAEICQQVEDCGFDASLLSQSEEAIMPSGSARMQPETAKLHLQALGDPISAFAAGQRVQLFLESMSGVLSTTLDGSLIRVTYRPDAVGARHLLQAVMDQGIDIQLADANASQSRVRGDIGLRRDLRRALPPTVIILIIVMVLPVTSFRQFLHFNCGVPGLHAETLLLFFLATPVQCFVGRRFHGAARRAMKRRSPNMDVLISIATCLAYGYSTLMMFFAVFLAMCGEQQDGPPPHFFETPCTLITVVLIGRLLEDGAKQRTAASLDELVRSSPPNARLVTDNKDRQELSTELVELGDEIEVWPGEVVPVDGPLLDCPVDSKDQLRAAAASEDRGDDPLSASAAAAAFDESLLTGESRPVPKGVGDLVIGGSRLASGRPCRIRAERVGSGSALAQIVALVERASASAGAAPAQRMADAIARVFVPSVVIVAALTSIIWLCLVSFGKVTMAARLHDHGRAFAKCEEVLFALKFGLSVLLVACPCALGLATPTAVMVSTGVAAKRGILIKSAMSMELAARRGCVIMDKTGTLTVGKPTVVAVAVCCNSKESQPGLCTTELGLLPAASASSDAGAQGIDITWLGQDGAKGQADEAEVRLLHGICVLMGASSSRAEHVLSRGLEEGACQILRCRGDPTRLLKGAPPIQDFEELRGRGVSFRLADLDVRVGSTAWVCQDLSPQLAQWVEAQRLLASTVVAIRASGELLGLAALRDPLQPLAKQLIQELEISGEEVWMCTGDHAATAAAVARELGLRPERVVSDSLPAHKAALAADLQSRGHRVLFVGDGVNDAPALTAADVGVAIGAGARVTVDAADVVLVRSDLRDLLAMLQLAQATSSCIKRNFAWAMVFNACMLPLAAGVFYNQGLHLPPAAAAAAMACSSITVVTSSLMLRRFKPVGCAASEVCDLQSFKVSREALPEPSRKKVRGIVPGFKLSKRQLEEMPLTEFRDDSAV